MCIISDFPAYSMLSGWNTKKKFTYPSCGFDTYSEWLDHGGKYFFFGHCRFLSLEQLYRCDRHYFNGRQEWRQALTLPSGLSVWD